MKTISLTSDKFVNFSRYLRVNYSHDAVPSLHAQEAIDKRDPARYSILHRLKHQPRDRLKWLFVTNTSRPKLPLAVMRNRLKRRWNEAFRQALLQHGYEHDGKRPARGPGEARPLGLHGTLQVLVMEAGGWDQPMDWLVKSANDLVGAMEKAGIKSSGDASQARTRLRTRT